MKNFNLIKKTEKATKTESKRDEGLMAKARVIIGEFHKAVEPLSDADLKATDAFAATYLTLQVDGVSVYPNRKNCLTDCIYYALKGGEKGEKAVSPNDVRNVLTGYLDELHNAVIGKADDQGDDDDDDDDDNETVTDDEQDDEQDDEPALSFRTLTSSEKQIYIALTENDIKKATELRKKYNITPARMAEIMAIIG